MMSLFVVRLLLFIPNTLLSATERTVLPIKECTWIIPITYLRCISFCPQSILSHVSSARGLLAACLRDPRPLCIRTDGDWVCKGMYSCSLWSRSGWPGDHSALWNLLVAELLSREGLVTVTWVKGHAKDFDVARGRTTREDKIGL